MYGLLKRQYDSACTHWMVNNPARPITIHDIGGILGQPYPKAFSCENIVSGFRVGGIWPFNPDIFDESEFLGACVTDRPDPTVELSISSTPIVDPGEGTSRCIVFYERKYIVPMYPSPRPNVHRARGTLERSWGFTIMTTTQ